MSKLHGGYRSPTIADSDWPLPGPEAQAHSERLIAHIRSRIDASDGWIGFADYMHEALYAPGLGYYSAGAVKFGADGDFVTAPELSPLFSRCVANQCAQILLATGGDTIVEPGAGSGVMAAEILAMLDRLDALPARYLIVEPSADLRERQRRCIEARVPEAAAIVQWLDAPPASIDGLVVGNEVLDALPCERFTIGASGIEQLGVSWADNRFVEATRPATDELVTLVEAIQRDTGKALPTGFRSEVRPAMGAYVADWARRLNSGVMLWIDYGCSRREYYAPARADGTLRCHYRHRAHDDPFVYPGLQDITAWVDFTTVAEAGVEAGCGLAGYTTQAHFLLGCGMEQQFTAMRAAAPDAAAELTLSNAVQRLLMPGDMGEKFRVIALERDLHTQLLGFTVRDLAASL